MPLLRLRQQEGQRGRQGQPEPVLHQVEEAQEGVVQHHLQQASATTRCGGGVRSGGRAQRAQEGRRRCSGARAVEAGPRGGARGRQRPAQARGGTLGLGDLEIKELENHGTLPRHDTRVHTRFPGGEEFLRLQRTRFPAEDTRGTPQSRSDTRGTKATNLGRFHNEHLTGFWNRKMSSS